MIEPNNLNAKLCMVVVFGIIFVVEIEQKQAIWCL